MLTAVESVPAVVPFVPLEVQDAESAIMSAAAANLKVLIIYVII